MIQPVGDRVLIKLTVQEKESSGGIILSAGSLDKILTGVVLAVGEGSRTSYGNLIPPTVKVGDKVLFGQYSGLDKWEEDGEDLYIIPDKEIRAIIED
jgi:chaperonin GroES